MIVLASASPRRKELLRLITDDFETEISGVAEDLDISDPKKLAVSLAELKANDVYSRRPSDLIIGADTLVYAGGEILGKPKDKADVLRMINTLSGAVHTVCTGVCIKSDGYNETFCEKTFVTFDKLSDEEIQSYINSADIYDKAGAYAVQGEAAKFISNIDGCFYNVMGLPVSRLYKSLKAAGAV